MASKSERGARRAAPYRQGDLDGLCGLYAIINAFAAVLAPTAPLGRPEARLLFGAGIVWLEGRKKLRAVAIGGMEDDLVFELAQHMAESLARWLGRAVDVSRPETGTWRRKRLLAVIDDALAHGHAVIAGLGHTHEHVSVIVGGTPSRFMLSDSDGLRWIARGSVGTENSIRRHRLGPRDIIVVKRLTGTDPATCPVETAGSVFMGCSLLTQSL